MRHPGPDPGSCQQYWLIFNHKIPGQARNDMERG